MNRLRRVPAPSRHDDPTRVADGHPGRSRVLRRKGVLLTALAVMFLPFGVPRWLNHDVAPVDAHAGARLSRLCRDHGGTPARASGPATPAAPQRLCTVRYGRHVYVMDAITTRGFDVDTAHFQRQGCDEARSAQKASTASARRRETFVYHPDTGVCERRP